MTKTPQKPEDRFEEIARKLETDEAPEHFERVVQHIVAVPIPAKEAKPVKDRK